MSITIGFTANAKRSIEISIAAEEARKVSRPIDNVTLAAIKEAFASAKFVFSSKLKADSTQKKSAAIDPLTRDAARNALAVAKSAFSSASKMSSSSEISSVSLKDFRSLKTSSAKSLKEFRENIRELFLLYENTQSVAKILSGIIPTSLNPQEVVSIIFEEARVTEIPILLDALLLLHPKLILSQYDRIRKSIIQDGKHLLSNSSIIDSFKECGLSNVQEKMKACFDLAYLTNHPNIYQLSQTPISVSDYSLNFLWVNLNPQDRVQAIAQNIFKDGLDLSENAECIKNPNALRILEKTEKSLSDEELKNWQCTKKSVAYRISKWADANPKAQINLWYDSALVTRRALQKTSEMMKDISQSRGVNLRLRDIRQLSNISGEIGHFLHPGTPLFFRVDLLKALITDHMINSPEEKAKYCVVSDIDVEPMSPQQIFDQRTLNYLSSNGYVFNRVGFNNFENSFFIFNRANETLKRIHYETIIEETASNITSLREHTLENARKIRNEFLLQSQYVYNRYYHFRNRMQESRKELLCPRKVVKCPESQFNFTGSWVESDHRRELCLFIGTSNVPFTFNGRGGELRWEQIDALMNWTAEPIVLTVAAVEKNQKATT